jgi:sialate O-acetylesterase
VTVALGDVSATGSANEREQWSVSLPAVKASAKPLTLLIEADNGLSRQVGNVLVGDVWYLTGSTQLTGEWPYSQRDAEAAVPEPMPLVREFRRKTKASTSETPRKRAFEIGGGRYQSSWQSADYSRPESGVTQFAYRFARALNRPGIPQGFITMSAGQGGRAKWTSSPLSWTSYEGVRDLEAPAFKQRLEELALQFPGSEIARRAVDRYVLAVKATVATIVEAGERGADLSAAAPLSFPGFPTAGRQGEIKPDMIPTYTYNWCVSPLTPMAVSGVIWVPGQYNIGEDPSDYAAELEAYAASLPKTYGQERVPFIYAQPSATLVEGLTTPRIADAKFLTFDAWPGSLKEMAAQMAGLVK